MKDDSRALLLVDAPPGWAPLLARIAGARDLHFEVARDATEAAALIAGPAKQSAFPLLVVAPGPTQLPAARALHRAHPAAQIVLLAEPEEELELRSAVQFDPLLGRSSDVVSLEPSSLGERLEELLTRALQRFSLRAVIDRINAQRTTRVQAAVDHGSVTERYLASILQQSPDGFFFADASGKVVVWNSSAERLFGWTPGMVVQLATFIPAQDQHQLLARVQRASAPICLEVERPDPRDGSSTAPLRTLEVSFAPVFDERDELMGVSAIARDITARKTELVEARERAEFERLLIGIVSHDLRSPMGSIALMAQILLSQEGLDERTTKAVTHILASADRAARMIRDLLDFTRARLSGGLPIERRPTDIHAVTAQVVRELQLSHSDRIIEVHHAGDGQGHWDADRIAQVLSNLLTNALTYSTSGTAVSVSTHGDREHLVVEVHNEGEPIPAETRAHLFEPLRRGAATSNTAARSIGLGLYIVDQIVRAHGGDILVTSLAGQGTTFRVRLPRQAVGRDRRTSTRSSNPGRPPH